MQCALVCLISFNDPAWKDEGHLGIAYLLVPLLSLQPIGVPGGAQLSSWKLCLIILTFLLLFLSALTGGTARHTQAHPPLPLYGVAGPRSPGDHPVPDPVCEDCQGLHQQDARGRAHRGALQVLSHAEPMT